MELTKTIDLAKYHSLLTDLDPIQCRGSVEQVIGLLIEAQGINARVGERCQICPSDQEDRTIEAEVVGFKNDRTLLMPLGQMQGIQRGSSVVASGSLFVVPVGEALLGRVLDGMGRPMDGKGPLNTSLTYPVVNDSPPPLNRVPISEPLVTGVRAIDGLLTTGKGQRIGIFAGSGVGKSTVLGMIARNSRSDVSVIGLIGERGREVREFIERDLGEDGLKRSVVVVSTSDQSALLRMKGAWIATAIAEYFRDQGHDVTFLMDSVTRFAMAQREIGLAIGEPPATKGYTPSVFATLPKLMERTGTSEKGTITGFYTVLVEADDLTEPVTDIARSVLDGHIVLSRDLAGKNHYPAIDVLGSVSRLMPAITEQTHRDWANRLREALATYDKARDLIDIGAYVDGSNPQIDHAIEVMPKVLAFLRQKAEEATPYEETLERLQMIFEEDADG